MRDPAEVVVIGAGPAGTACAAELVRAAVPTLVLEQADAVASRWRRHYDRLRLNTSRWLSRLPGTRYPAGTGLFPARDEVVRHIEAHAERHGLDVRFQTRVHRIDRDHEAWLLRTSKGDLRVPHVVVATGLYGVPVIPAWQGREKYGGEVVHSSAYRNAHPFRGRSVLVVGPGSSGMEIAYELAEAGARKVSLAVRTPPNIILRSIAGLPGDPAALLLLRLPTWIGDAVLRVVRRLTLGDLSARGLPAPTDGPFEKLRRDGTGPAVVDREVIDAIRSGAIEIVAAVTSLDERGVRLADGRRIEVDAVIAATGYRTGLEPMVGHLGVLDERGVPRRAGGEEAAPGLRFLGFSPVPALIHDVAKRARAIARAIAAARRRAIERSTDSSRVESEGTLPSDRAGAR